MSSVLSTLRSAQFQYEKFVLNHNSAIGMVESIFRTSLFMMPSRLQSSELKSEALYSAVGLLTLVHDLIYIKHFRKFAARAPPSPEMSKALNSLPSPSNLRASKWLAAIRFVELFFEMAAYSYFLHRRSKKHEKCRSEWVVILVVEILKAMIKLYHYKKSKSAVLTNLSIPPRNSWTITMMQVSNYEPSEDEQGDWGGMEDQSRHSERTGKRPTLLSALESRISEAEVSYRKKQLLAESLAMLRPIVYVAGCIVFGGRSWKPWILSLLCDLGSLRLSRAKTPQELQELESRKTELFLYLFRSPVADILATNIIPRFQRFKFLAILLEAYTSWYFFTAAS